MLTSKQCYAHYGHPEIERRMTVIRLPDEVYNKLKLRRLYCNKDFASVLTEAFNNVVSRGLISQLKSIDGCFCIRRMRGSQSWSLHSWGVAIDICAKTNLMGKKPQISPELVACFKDAGADWGGDWASPDGMHFQMKEIPR